MRSAYSFSALIVAVLLLFSLGCSSESNDEIAPVAVGSEQKLRTTSSERGLYRGANEQLTVWLPSGWEEDIEYGERVFGVSAEASDVNLPFAAVSFYGGVPFSAGYDPSLFLLNVAPVPRTLNLADYVESEVDFILEDGTGTVVTDRRTLPVSGFTGELVEMLDSDGFGFTQIYLIVKGNVWILQCGSYEPKSPRMTECMEILAGVQFD